MNPITQSEFRSRLVPGTKYRSMFVRIHAKHWEEREVLRQSPKEMVSLILNGEEQGRQVILPYTGIKILEHKEGSYGIYDHDGKGLFLIKV